MDVKRRGKFIVFEGNECCGKTSVIPRVADNLRSKGYTVFTFREPGGTPAGEDIRNIILNKKYKDSINYLTEALLFAAARSEVVEKVLIPALNEYDFVFADRFYYSSFVWQGMVRGLEKFVYTINQNFMDMVTPNLALFLNITEETRLERMQKRGKENRLDNEPLYLLRQVDDGYQKLVNMFPEFISIDANGDLESVVTACTKEILDMPKDVQYLSTEQASDEKKNVFCKVHTKNIYLPKAHLMDIKKWLTEGYHEDELPFAHTDGTLISYTANFNDGYEMDIRVRQITKTGIKKSEQENSVLLAEAVLYQNGKLIAMSESKHTFETRWSIDYGKDVFAVNIIGIEMGYDET